MMIWSEKDGQATKTGFISQQKAGILYNI
jgi:hypothetical protein